MDASIYKASPMYCYWLVGNDWFDSRGILWVCNAIGIVTAGMEYKSYTTCSVLLLWPIIVSGTAKASWRSESYMINIGLAFTFGGENDATIHGAVGIFTVLDWEEAYYTIHDAWTWVKATQGMHPFDEIASSFQTLLEMRVSSKRSKTRKSYLKPQLFQISKMVLF
jgi:hypothetical protein